MTTKEKKYKPLLPNDYFYIKRIKELGITERYMGFYYIIEILDLMLNESVVVRSFSKEVYPNIAKKYNKQSSTIERNIRSLINKFWDENLRFALKDFYAKKQKPSCCEFIYVLKNYILKEIAE